MKVKDVLILEEAVIDLEGGKHFYDEKESGVGDYFWDSLLADIEAIAISIPVYNRYVEKAREAQIGAQK
ncbi:MAG TPA: hypothetical protein ENJ08_01620 [Gammaproteobacteria bacterium]|nr:hypothetical protein [Gammaproteobacteria bacterium]